MIRFYKTYLGRMLLGLLILIELEKESGKQAVADAASKWKGSDAEERLVDKAIAEYMHPYPEETPTNDDVVKGAIGQLSKKKTDDGDLLDTIVDVLRLPFASYLSSGTLKLLRDAILNPGELTDLRKAFKAQSKCGCGHTFTAQEIISITVSQDTITLHCTACQRPNYVRCDHCDQVVLLSGKTTMTWRNGVDCGCTKRAENAAEQQATGLSAAQLRTIHRQAARAGGPQAPIPTPNAQTLRFYEGGLMPNIAPAALDVEETDEF